jgi:hypothetical protein
MFFNTEPDYESLKKTVINPSPIIEVKRSSKINIPSKDISDSGYKRPLKIQSRPEKRIKIPMKTNYEFLETQIENISPDVSRKSSNFSNNGLFTSKLSKFLAKEAKDKISGFVTDSKMTLGCKMITVDLGDKNGREFFGVMTLIHYCGTEFKGKVMIHGPKKVRLNGSDYLICKDISH